MTGDRYSLVLAGGQSRRLGQDKALLPWGEDTLLTHVCAIARTVTGEVILVAPHGRPYGANGADRWLDDAWGQGPLVAIAQGLAIVPETAWVLVLACDLPRLDATVLRGWAHHLTNLAPAVMAYLPFAQGWHPLCGWYRAAQREALQTFVERGGRACHTWLAEMPVAIAPCPAPMLTNLNTPADWQAWRADQSSQSQIKR
ncbi:MAG: NTP transferase domain-containing protein [Oscillatoriales cyanobacterium SM2_1_8]|nr:NTP transferase domain-containing protein [Oscillatoriales cyanobacterium SM2_1_8]